MEWLSGFLDQIIAFFQWIWDFFAQGIYDFVRDGLVVATKASMYAALQTLILLIDVSYTAARELIDSLGVPQMIRSMYAALPGPIAAGLAFFGVPQALNIIMGRGGDALLHALRAVHWEVIRVDQDPSRPQWLLQNLRRDPG
ncbi:unnamed protein product [Primolicivirus Pf1]|uniref:Head virion protein G6P n=33 Tax=root TaxID=1 RepID=G6P_BPPF1|nr:hypothetical protein Pf1p06 [Primolicivirus Pf1]Q38066.1 RecName: Full=Head virion protein G6P; AltName: Full=Coat protein D; AltName: Full=G6P [Primolicivirus Pf1]CAA36333.1 unnamed protein product [Primolicivirus Pf1]